MGRLYPKYNSSPSNTNKNEMNICSFTRKSLDLITSEVLRENLYNKINITPVPPPMPSEVLLVQLLAINNASNSVDGGTKYKFARLSQAYTST